MLPPSVVERREETREGVRREVEWSGEERRGQERRGGERRGEERRGEEKRQGELCKTKDSLTM
eukprot:762537-Hanusia_phi.AAC.3